MHKLLLAIIIPASFAMAQTRVISPSTHVGFDTPEGWALKYFTSATMMSGLQPPQPLDEQRRIGSFTFGLELGWLPSLNSTRARVGFAGHKEEDINKAPIFFRPTLRVNLPWRFTLIAAGTPPIEVFGVTPRLFALGVERPIVERRQWTLGWRLTGQAGSVEGAFTCPPRAVGLPTGPQNPSGCIGPSSDRATLRYAGSEALFAYRIPKAPRIVPHISEGFNFIDSVFHVDAPLRTVTDHTREWTRGTTFTTTAGVGVLLTDRMALTVDAFYTPIGVQRNPLGPRMVDGLFNVRGLISYRFR